MHLSKLLTFVFLFTSYAQADSRQVDKINVVYGTDNRKDYFQSSATFKKLAHSTAGMVALARFTKGRDQHHLDLISPLSLENKSNVCPNEKFAQQLTAPRCSGFLVAPDLLMTAGHCILKNATAEQSCRDYAWVFDYHMKSAGHNPSKDIPLTAIFTCKEVLSAIYNPSADYALIRLNRPVTGREPLKLRTSGQVASSALLVVIGHPSGLPTKISDKGRITDNSKSETFVTTLDTFHGNSGSAVFDAATGMVEGILIQGKSDYLPSDKKDPKSCRVTNLCDESASNCAAGPEMGPIEKGEVVFRIGKTSSSIKQAMKR